jgi:UDP:flavonoid glycosyltransferase YjiC (YdhE family)
MSKYRLTSGSTRPDGSEQPQSGVVRRRRILFVAEAITLAQVVRLVALARSLDRNRYEVYFACGEFDPIAFAGTDIDPIPLLTVEREAALRKVDRGERLYETGTLERYVQEELRLFDSIRPDFVVSDFRLSLPISATLAGVPHAALINAYFSPFAVRDGFPVPEHPLVSLLGYERAARYFPRALPAVFAHFAKPIDAVRKRYGLPPSGGLLQAISAGDFTLYPDVPELCPTRDLPASHRYLGHIPWSPNVPLPRFLEELGANRPVVYITLGSSGRLSALDTVLRVIAELPVLGVISTAGRFELRDVPTNVRVERYLPGALVSRASSFVVTNGGASTSYQALAEGRPVLGIPSNLDQYLAMTAIERAGAGRLVRAGEATETAVRRAMNELLSSETLRTGAERIQQAFAGKPYDLNFAALLDEVFASASSPPQVAHLEEQA